MRKKSFRATIFNEQGQLSVFYGMCLLLIVTSIAFTVNVGLFVKAKINLQNAVDAAAWSGASVQARQLTTIAYLNWELRNTYKEWMFKYYVLGNQGNPKTHNPTTPNMDFTMKASPLDPTQIDRYNVPSVCIEIQGTSTPMCPVFNVPGLPRFHKLGLTSLDDTVAQLSNTLISTKGADCSRRSDLNYLTLLRWVYGVPETPGAPPSNLIFARAPLIAANRTGAWIKAVELALRIRNLEKIMNLTPGDARTPVALCQSGSSCIPINTLYQNGAAHPLYERTVKAFWSAFRNLENNDPNADLKRTFKMTEIIPQSAISGGSTSTVSTIPVNNAALVGYKPYVDLHLHTVNMVALFTIFTSALGQVNINSTAMSTDASCGATKTALPIPVYPFGFVKNPEVLTYYAVKGEADYIGLFNPFSGDGSVHLFAFAAAKPFGGRIGPMIYMSNSANNSTKQQVFVRAQPPQRTYPYLSYISPFPNNRATANPSDPSARSGLYYVRGDPIPNPATSSFWISNGSLGSAIGGVPSGGNVVYGIPNMIYSNVALTAQSGGSQSIQEINPNLAPVGGKAPIENAGLFNAQQFKSFRSNFNLASIDQSIIKARAPTSYEAANYLIPTAHRQEGGGGGGLGPPDTPEMAVGQPGLIPGTSALSVTFPLFAPLWGDGGRGTYYHQSEIETVLADYIRQTTSSIQIYISALKDVATAIRSSMIYTPNGTYNPTPEQAGIDTNLYENAANEIYNPKDPCSSMAGKFEYFFLGSTNSAGVKCPGIDPLTLLIQNFWNQEQMRNNSFKDYYFVTYTSPLNTNSDYSPADMSRPSDKLMTAYLPGPAYGADTISGLFPHPYIQEARINARRNYYSTKFIAIKSLTDSGAHGILPYVSTGGSSFAIYSEKDHSTLAELQYTFANPIPPSIFSGVKPLRPVLE
ncbi:MAG: Tad domain-containing protein [Oligoflexia bacterium]|nr:Tad domain-containing protein [Oligoflexia bacterium]MBF0364551.1 Tad domain-containing protein [Oligoflexia bacterium]